MIVTAVVTMNTTVTATTPPMMAAVLSHSELLVTHSAWETSEAAIKSNNYYSTLCSFEKVPVEKVMGRLSVVPATLLALTVTV